MDTRSRSTSIWIYLVPLLLLGALQIFVFSRAAPSKLPYSELRAALTAGRVIEVAVGTSAVTGRMRASADPTSPEQTFETTPVEDPDLLRELLKQNVKVVGVPTSSTWGAVAGWLLPIGLLVGWLILLRRGAGGGLGGNGALLSVGRNKARLYMEKESKVGFADVAGVDEAKEELQEVIEFLRHPEKFGRLGGKMPKGILLVGPPGTGKTLLARAVAGEAGVAFFSISGSEFVEMFVGVGAARVRDLFEQARLKAPCIIFIDELDALGKVRGVGPMSHDEREQTLNQLLVELDGFDPRSGVVLMAATNRPEILDPALLRPGRFDRHVLVDRPDKPGRLAILRVHARGVQLEDAADLEPIAAMTPGFAGADLANLINEAALLAVRRGQEKVRRVDLQEAVERIIGGLEKRNRVLNPMERERVAHHEVGHALVALSLPGSDEVRKISIVPRGIAALGYTLQLPTEDRFLMTQGELENKIAVLLGGRVAEELVYGDASTGAHDDLAKATQLATSMVRSYGMSPRIGLVRLEPSARDRMALPLEAMGDPGASESTLRSVDAEVRRIIEEQHRRVTTLLGGRRQALVQTAQALLSRETLEGPELRTLIDAAREPGAEDHPHEPHQSVA